jgi:hypothetical protein
MHFSAPATWLLIAIAVLALGGALLSIWQARR